MYYDFSLDIETAATSPMAAVTQIGLAVMKDGEILENEGLNLKVNTDEYDSTYRGIFDVEINTMVWWARQSPEAFNAAFGHPNPHNIPDVNDDRLPLSVCLKLMSEEVNRIAGNKKKRVWAKPPTFDIAIMRYAYKELGMSSMFPFHFREERCLKTIMDAIPKDASIHGRPFQGAQHDAYVDALHQLKQLRSILIKLDRV